MLRAARLYSGLSQSELAKQFSVSQTTIKNWEAGKKFPKTDQVSAWILLELEKLSDAMQLIIDFDEIQGTPKSVETIGLDEQSLKAFSLAALSLALGSEPIFNID